jgi:hypothetical protein
MNKIFITAVFSLCCFICFAQQPGTPKQKAINNTIKPAATTQKVKIQSLNTKLLKLLDAQAAQLKQAEANAAKIEELRKELEKTQKEIEAEDRLGNFEIQRLMSAFNQMETLASNVLKKSSETSKGVIGKID